MQPNSSELEGECILKSSPKERILAVERILQQRRCVSTTEIMLALEREYDIRADRKSIYDDIAVLTKFMPIETIGRSQSFRYVLSTF